MPSSRLQSVLPPLRVALLLISASVAGAAWAQFQFNFSASGGTVVGSIANQSCGGTGGGMGGGMGGMGGRCDGTPFSQQVVSIGGQQYYHVVVGTGGSEFALEYYMRTSGLCWWGCPNARVQGGMMGGMGGPSPLSSSMGDAANDGAPIAPQNAGTGNPSRVALRQINNTPELTQEFLKATEAQKPRITQSLNSNGVQMDFSIDMTNSTYSDMNTPGTVTLTQAIDLPGVPEPGNNPATGQPLPRSDRFDINNNNLPNSKREITGGRFTYSAGSGDGGSLGTYNYFADTFDVYNVDWQSYCVPSQNPASGCTNWPINRGGMGGGGGGAMGGMGGAAAPAPAPAVPGGGGGGMGGGGTGGGMLGGMSVANAALTTPIAITTTTLSGTMGGGGLAGGGAMGGSPSAGVTFSTAATTTTTTLTGAFVGGDAAGGSMGGGAFTPARATPSSVSAITRSTAALSTAAATTTTNRIGQR